MGSLFKCENRSPDSIRNGIFKDEDNSCLVSYVQNVGRMEEGRNAFKMLKGKFPGRRPLGKPMYRKVLEYNLKYIVLNLKNGIICLRIRIFRRTFLNVVG